MEKSMSMTPRPASRGMLMSMLALDTFRRLIMSYLWFPELIQVSYLAKEVHQLIREDVHLAKELLKRLLIHCQRMKAEDNLIAEHVNTSFDVLQYVKRLTDYPVRSVLSQATKQGSMRAMRLEAERYGLQMVSLEGRECVVYQGKCQDENRSFVCDAPFPHSLMSLGCHRRLRGTALHRDALDLDAHCPAAALPFTKVVPGHGGMRVVLSHVAYFEIAIHSERRPPNIDMDNHTGTGSSRNNLRPCVCIGVARPSFPLRRRLPGWDRHSYGWHGDDGLWFDGNAAEGQALSHDPFAAAQAQATSHSHSDSEEDRSSNSSRFGAGDTVGLGVLYPHRNQAGYFLLTKNGVLVGVQPILDIHYDRHCWHPTVGTDCYNPIEVNLGNDSSRPFAFDILQWERRPTSASVCATLRRSEAYQRCVRSVEALTASLAPRPGHSAGYGLYRTLHPDCLTVSRGNNGFQWDLAQRRTRRSVILEDYCHHHRLLDLYCDDMGGSHDNTSSGQGDVANSSGGHSDGNDEDSDPGDSDYSAAEDSDNDGSDEEDSDEDEAAHALWAADSQFIRAELKRLYEERHRNKRRRSRSLGELIQQIFPNIDRDEEELSIC